MKMEHSEPTLNYMASIMLHPRNKYLGSILSTPCIANGMIYLGDSKGYFYAVRVSVS